MPVVDRTAVKNTLQEGVPQGARFREKNDGKTAGDMSAIKGVPKGDPGVSARRGVPAPERGAIRRAVPTVQEKARCLYGEDFGADNCKAYPAKGTPYCAGHLRKLGDL